MPDDRPAAENVAGPLLRWSAALLAGLVALGWVLVFLLALAATGNTTFIDWWTYALGTQRVLGGEWLYLPEQLGGPYSLPAVTPAGYIQPPPSALVFVPFAFGGLGLAAWLIFNVAVFFSGLAAILKRELGSVRPVALALALLGLVVTIPLPEGRLLVPFPDGLGNANANVALAGLLAWVWATGERRRWIPWVAGVAWTFKMFPGALALWALRRDGWRALAVALGVAVIVVVVSLPILGVEEWRRFFTALSYAEPTCEGGRTSVACLVLPLTGSSLAKLVGMLTGATLLGLALVVRAEFPAFVLLTLGMLAPIADGHQHYLLFFYVLLVIGACRLVARRRTRMGPAISCAT